MLWGIRGGAHFLRNLRPLFILRVLASGLMAGKRGGFVLVQKHWGEDDRGMGMMERDLDTIGSVRFRN